MIAPDKRDTLYLLKGPCYSQDGECDTYTYARGYHFFAVVETPFVLVSLIPVLFLFLFFRKHPDAWSRVKNDLSPSLFVLAVSTAVGLYVELHLALTDWLDMHRDEFHCSLTFNAMTMLGTLYSCFIPVSLLMEIVSVFFPLIRRVKHYIELAWAGILILLYLISMTIGDEVPTIMCDFATIHYDIFYNQVHVANPRDWVTVALICVLCILTMINCALDRLNIPHVFMKVDFFNVKQSLALCLPLIIAFLGGRWFGAFRHSDYQSLDDFMYRMFAASFFFGISAFLLILFNYRADFWATFSSSLAFHKREKFNVATTMKIVKPTTAYDDYYGCHGTDCDYYYEQQRQRYQRLARFDAPFCIASFIPVMFLMNMYWKDEKAWKRDRVLLTPTFVVLGFTAVLGLYTEVHLALIDWLDIGLTYDNCNLTFNTLLGLGMTPYLFFPIIPLLQLIDCFFTINPVVKQLIAYAWAAFLFGIRLIHMIAGNPSPGIMCYGARVFPNLFEYELGYVNVCRNIAAILGCAVIMLGLISALKKKEMPFLSVDLHTVKRTFALTFPTLVLIIAHSAIDARYYHERQLLEFNLRILFSSCHFGSIALLLILLNHLDSFWKFLSDSLFFHKKTSVDFTDAKIII